jgi:hypothetical protein
VYHSPEMQDKLTWALPRADGCGRYSLPVFADGTREARASAYLAGTETYSHHVDMQIGF